MSRISDLLASTSTDFLPHPPSLRLFGPRVPRALWSRLQPGFTPRATSRSRTYSSGPPFPPGHGRPSLCQNGVRSFVAPGPASRRAQVAQPIHPVSACHLRVCPGGDAAPGPRTLRSAPDSHTIPTRSALDSHRFALDSHPIRTRISLDTHPAHSRIGLDSRERNYKLFAHLSQGAMCAQPIWLRMPLAGRAGPQQDSELATSIQVVSKGPRASDLRQGPLHHPG